ncbi:MAG: dihydrolipoyllysine-residue acetyltransferase [Neomegalonema sp.]|nr:dihydrolipoyllysine-residue acetyltransferase [Neomegalonema sp.]
MAQIDVTVPDIGDFSDVPVIEVLVNVGDSVSEEDPLITLESDKATMEVPSPAAGTVRELKVKLGDKVSEGTLVLVLDGDGEGSGAGSADEAAPAAEEARSEMAVSVPDIGDFKDVPVIEILVKVGDEVAAEDALVTLESDKATMEVPAPAAGTVTAIALSVGDKVSEGSAILTLAVKGAAPAAATPKSNGAAAAAPSTSAPTSAPSKAPAQGGGLPIPNLTDFDLVHAAPSVRRLARELDLDLTKLKGTGEKGRITKEDVKKALSGSSSGAAISGGMGIPPIPEVDFSKFGPIETVEMPRIKKLSGPFLHRAWLNIPHVTNHDEADITEVDQFRKELDTAGKAEGYRVTLLSFLIKASCKALAEHWIVNSSIAPDGQSLIRKNYYHIGFAADTPDGLVVPVIKDANKKGVIEISKELGELSAKARDGKLKPAEMSGASFTISSLGGIGGTSFTPIVNAPEVAILGVSRSKMAPVWDGKTFAPRNMLPLSLSYDHRAIDGALAARFLVSLKTLLGDVRRLLL